MKVGNPLSANSLPLCRRGRGYAGRVLEGVKTQTIARAAGGFWLMTIAAGMLAMGGGARGTAANLVATACYFTTRWEISPDECS